MVATEADIRWLERQKDNGHCGEGHMERQMRCDHNDRIDRLLRALSMKGYPTAPSELQARSAKHG